MVVVGTNELIPGDGDVVETDDGLAVTPVALTGAPWRAYADHRMAHAGVVVGAAVDDVLVEDVATIAIIIKIH